MQTLPRRHHLLSIIATGSLAACTTTATLPPPAAPGISLATMQEATRTLASDEFEGREPGTRGEGLTIAYLAEQFAAAGLEPGNDGSWFQDVPLVEITGSNFAPLELSGGGVSLSFDYATDWVGVSYRQMPRTAINGSELIFVGYGINAPEKGWNDYEGVDMRGKTALILVNDPDYSTETLEGPFNGRAMTYYGRWTYKYEEAARQGATGAIIIHEDFPAAYGWNVVESSWSGPQAYADTGTGGMDQTAMNGWITLDAAKAMFDAAGLDMEALTAAASEPGFEAVPMNLAVSTSFDNDFRRFTSRNVVGVLPGNSRPDEYVLHTAHWDHLGRCTPNEEGDDICNGAIDNATGTAALIALAEAHKEAGGTGRSQVFLAVTAEESGLLGAEYYGANPIYPLSQTVGGVNIDALHVTGPARDVISIGSGKSELDFVVTEALAAQGRVLSPDSSPQAGRYYRSDHFGLAKRGVPMIYLKAGIDLVDGGTEAGMAMDEEYTAHAYHGPDDEYNESWDWRGVMMDLELYYAIGRDLGNRSDWPNWYPQDEFRMIRDASCAGEGGC
ncbi:M28 family metallopeptidase [Alteraurantiacibacter aquimixticola]|uniref:M28 family peptidase n=1 Tax=Alteraurantiacibacter aquimixticola TaxID=2489173 RepID=A0A4T3EWX7_9SPHN|nr:M28 family metallopeptidase [Alteraurantiacibacter aquimixticola]TIX49003.1 M28 family peptidase [Alteraurantiacibacter aquimixticola]